MVLDSPEPDVLVLDHVGNDLITVEGGANDVFYLPGTAGDYLPFTAGDPAIPVFAADGTQLYEVLGGGDIRFVNDTPITANDDTILATIDAGAVDVGVSRLLANDIGADILLIGPATATLTDQGGFLLPTGSPLQRFDYQPPAGFSGVDSAIYEITDVLGRTATGTVFFAVRNNAPVAPDVSLTVAPGSVIRAEDLVALVTDADNDGILFAGFGYDPAGLQLQVVPVPGSSLPGALVNPIAGQSSGTFRYIVFDDSGVIGNVRGGDVTLTFTPSGPPPVFRLEPVVLSVKEGTPPPGDTSFDGMIGGFISFDLVRVSGGDDAAQVYLTVLGGGTNPATGDDLFAGMGDFVAGIGQGVDRERVDIVVKADALAEGNETFVVALTSASVGTVETTSFTATIVDDDAPPLPPPPFFTLRLAETSVFEDTGGFEIIIERAATSDLSLATLLIPITGVGANPIDENDLQMGLGVISTLIAEGATERRISFNPARDSVFENDETFSVSLSSVSIGSFDPTPVIATILNDDLPPPTFALSVNENVELEGSPPFGGGRIGVRIERTGGAADAATLTLSVGAGTIGTPASAGDIAGGFRTFDVTIGEGEQFAFFPLFAVPDTLFENDESISVSLVSSTVGTVDTTPVTAVIFNDDAPENRAPVAANDSFTTRPGQLLTIAAPGLLANDSDPDGDAIIAAQFSQGVQGGVVTLVTDGSFTYTPPDGFTGTDTFTYRIFDGVAFSDLATITMMVGAANAVPTDIALTNATVLENLPAGTLIGLLAATDPDAGDSLAFSFAPGGNAGGLFRIDGNRLLTDAVLDHEAAATRGITLRVTDSAGNTYDEAFTIAVGDVAEGRPADPVQPVTINGLGFPVSNGNAGTPATATPGGPALGSDTLSPLVDTAPIIVPGEATPRARIENEDDWNGLKNLVLGPSFWTPALGTDVLVANFVDVRWDLSTAPALDFDLLIVGGKRGAVTLAGGDDVLTWVFHSNEGPGTTPPRSPAGQATIRSSSPPSGSAGSMTRCWPTMPTRPTARSGTRPMTAVSAPRWRAGARVTM